MKRLLHLAIASSLTFGCLVSTANSQEHGQPVISTDRPTVGSSPDLVPARSLQVENGIGASFQRNHFIGDLPEYLLRLGLTQRVEVRFLFGNEVYQHSNTPHLPSLQTLDPAFSMKISLGKPTTLYPRSAIVSLSFPRGGPSWTSGSYDPGLTFIWTQAFKRGYFLNELVGGTLTTLGDARRMAWAPSLAGGRAISNTITGFAEYAPTVLASGSSEYVVDGGFAVVFQKLHQFDVRGGYINDPAGYHTLLSVGYSIRRDEVVRTFHHTF